MKIIERIDINLIYSSDCGEITFDGLLNDGLFIDPQDSTLESFYCAQGGLELKADRIFTFYRSINFSDHFFAVYFLLESLLYLGKIDKSVFRNSSRKIYDEMINDINEKKVVTLTHSNNAHLQLIKNPDCNYCKLSFNNENTSVTDERNNPYFNDIMINADNWVKAVAVALEDYFNFLQKSMNIAKCTNSELVLVRFYNLWIDIIGVRNR